MTIGDGIAAYGQWKFYIELLDDITIPIGLILGGYLIFRAIKYFVTYDDEH